MSQSQASRLVAHVRLVTVIRDLLVARDRESERVALLELWTARLNSVEVAN